MEIIIFLLSSIFTLAVFIGGLILGHALKDGKIDRKIEEYTRTLTKPQSKQSGPIKAPTPKEILDSKSAELKRVRELLQNPYG